MTKAKKRNIGIASIVPLLLLIITLIYEDSILDGLFSTGQHHLANSAIVENYDTLVIFYGITAVTAIAVLLYLIVHVAKLKNMTSGRKILWISALTLFLPVSFPVFWFLQIKTEPKILDTKADIS